MNEPILAFRKRNMIMMISFFLMFTLFAVSIFGGYLQKGFSGWIVLGIILTIIIPFTFLFDNMKSALYVYHDRLTIKGIKSEIDIPFSKIYHVYYRKEGKAIRNVNGTIESKTMAGLILKNQQNKKVAEIDLSSFKTKEDVITFLTFLKQHCPHIIFDPTAQSMLEGRFNLTNPNPYVVLIIMILFNLIFFSIVIEEILS